MLIVQWLLDQVQRHVDQVQHLARHRTEHQIGNFSQTAGASYHPGAVTFGDRLGDGIGRAADGDALSEEGTGISENLLCGNQIFSQVF